MHLAQALCRLQQLALPCALWESKWTGSVLERKLQWRWGGKGNRLHRRASVGGTTPLAPQRVYGSPMGAILSGFPWLSIRLKIIDERVYHWRCPFTWKKMPNINVVVWLLPWHRSYQRLSRSNEHVWTHSQCPLCRWCVPNVPLCTTCIQQTQSLVAFEFPLSRFRQRRLRTSPVLFIGVCLCYRDLIITLWGRKYRLDLECNHARVGYFICGVVNDQCFIIT